MDNMQTQPALTLAACLLTLSLPHTHSQTTSAPPGKLPTYDVASIRPNNTGSHHVHISDHDEVFQAENASVKDLLEEAFDIQRNLIFGLPAWTAGKHFDIDAKVLDADPKQLGQLTPEQRRQMFLTLYTGRFGLKWHYENRTVPTYELTVTKDGPKLQHSPDPNGRDGTSMQNTDLTVTNEPLTALAQELSRDLERPVVDKTGLTGKYDLHLKWSRQDAPAADAGQDPDAPPPLFTALEEQLGLKLLPGKDPVKVIVIDSLTPPTAN